MDTDMLTDIHTSSNVPTVQSLMPSRLLPGVCWTLLLHSVSLTGRHSTSCLRGSDGCELKAHSMVNDPCKEDFPFVHPSIASYLQCRYPSPRSFVDPATLRISVPSEVDCAIDVDLLVELACCCEEVLLNSPNSVKALPNHLQGLLRLSRNGAETTVATLLSLNVLEASIRNRAGHKAGKAPQLQAMLHHIDAEPIGSILRAFLLAKNGLNFRNLLWHGFVTNLPRAWLALIVVLVVNVDTSQDLEAVVLPNSATTIVQSVLKEDKGLEIDFCIIEEWIPESHRGLLGLVKAWCDKRCYPASSLAVLSILLEHALRLDWCRVNGQTDHSIARPGYFYVTLDGHSRRRTNEQLLYPCVSADNSLPNKLVSHLGGGVIALWTDLFASSSGGPNIRAALSHGLWDEALHAEMTCMAGAEVPYDSAVQDCLWDLVQVMLLGMQASAAPSTVGPVASYRPMFSYSATTARNIKTAFALLEKLNSIQQSAEFLNVCKTATVMVDVADLRERLSVAKEPTKHLGDKFMSCLPSQAAGRAWTNDDVIAEHKTNVAMASFGASRQLLEDCVQFLEDYESRLNNALCALNADSLSDRQRRRAVRLCSLVGLAHDLYNFAIGVALLSMQTKLMMLPTPVEPRGVDRCRMCVSTFSTFLAANADRSIKSVAELLRGKPTKAVLKWLTDESARLQSHKGGQNTGTNDGVACGS